ncbi:hypothetical protein [Lysinibacter cavernae]|uniref:Uncharacterized protein n=1 Tax=Lysinibacter cavernae TaxID=1640652 RepID=A0A7X5R419_9MICO|nr:hypothetical protein [Lysinibacter cavernae]NIH54962.1 hypothetical protein [Lysinibacter cavernae]
MQIMLSHAEILALVGSGRLPDFVQHPRESDGVYRVDLVLSKVPGGGAKLALAAALFGKVTLALRPSTDAAADAADGMAPRLTVRITVESAGIPAGEVLGRVRETILDAAEEASLAEAVRVTVDGSSATLLVDCQAVASRYAPEFLVTSVGLDAYGLNAAATLR